MATVTGTDGDDFIHRLGDGRVVPAGFEDVTGVTIGNDVIRGNDGNDQIYGDDGNDVINGDVYHTSNDGYGSGFGDDYIFGGAGDDTINGDSYDEYESEYYGTGADHIYGGDGRDSIRGGNGDDVIDGGAGDDVIEGDYFYENLRARYGIGNDHISGGDGNDVITGGDGDDVIDGGTGDDIIKGDYYDNWEGYRASNDDISGGDGNDVIYGGGGTDTVAGDAGDDTIYGGAGSDVIDGGAGADTIVGSAGDDTINGGDGNDVIDGGDGADTLVGGAGDDTYVVPIATTITDVITEEADGGIDTVELRNTASVQLTYYLPDLLENLTFSGSRGIIGYGNGANNSLTSTQGPNQLYGLEGEDALHGGSGADLLDGGIGSDAMYGGAGNDTYVVDDAGDTVHEDAIGGVDLVESTVTYTLAANVEKLTLMGASALDGTGNDIANTLTGNDAANVLSGLDGNDRLYGLEGDDTLYGGAGNDRLEGGAGRDAMYGGAGNDVYQVGNNADSVHENAGEGNDLVESTITHTLAANVEKLTLMGVAAINGTGNGLGNTLVGNAAANVLDGGAGADIMSGGAGDDTYIVDQADDEISEGSSGGIDTVLASVSYDIGGQYIERLTLTGTSAIDATGNTLANALTGNSAANRLDGNTGADRMYGGAGDDTYVVDQAGDKVYEANGEGNDTVLSSISFDLTGQYLENLTLTGTSAIDGTGNSLANILLGNAAANRLDGMAGNDEMRGGKGDDTYVVSQTGDRAYEPNNQGIDTVQSSVSYDLDGQYIEKLTLTGTSAINGTGNTLDNVLTGNGAANLLDGKGGVDEMRGGAGNDTYVVGQVGDKAYERDDEGTDTVLSSVSYDLTGQFIERLTLTGTSMINATGNTLDNVLTGNSAANVLDGKTGMDRMYGGAGDDTYVVSQAGDKAYELTNEGIDTVLSSVSYDLTGQYVENLTLTGASAISATGNSLDNSLVGNNGANVLDGGVGNDILRGNGGNDIFSFSTSPALVADPDIIADFSNISGNKDSIRLDHDAFTALSPAGTLAAAAFKDLALGAVDSSDRIIYDSARGDLFYDADGSGSAQAVKFAHLDNHATLTNTDFSVI